MNLALDFNRTTIWVDSMETAVWLFGIWEARCLGTAVIIYDHPSVHPLRSVLFWSYITCLYISLNNYLASSFHENNAKILLYIIYSISL